MTLASVKDVTGVTKNVILGVADFIRDQENGNVEETKDAQNENNNGSAKQKEENAQE